MDHHPEHALACPYCHKAMSGIDVGEHRCTRCSGIFRLDSSGQPARAKRSRCWLAVMYAGYAAAIAFAVLVFVDRASSGLSSVGARVLFPAFSFAFSIGLTGGIVHALRTGEVCLGKRKLYREDGPVYFYVCLVVAALAAILAVAAAMKMIFEA